MLICWKAVMSPTTQGKSLNADLLKKQWCQPLYFKESWCHRISAIFLKALEFYYDEWKCSTHSKHEFAFPAKSAVWMLIGWKAEQIKVQCMLWQNFSQLKKKLHTNRDSWNDRTGNDPVSLHCRVSIIKILFFIPKIISCMISPPTNAMWAIYIN